MSLETAIQELAKANFALAEAIKVDTAARYYVAERMGFSGIAAPAPAPVESQEAMQPTPEPIPEQTYKPEGFKAVAPVETVEEAEKVEAERPEEEQPPMDFHEYTQINAALGKKLKERYGVDASKKCTEICARYGAKNLSSVPAEYRRQVIASMEELAGAER